MHTRKIVVALMAFFLVAGIASADLKVVKKTHRDGFQIMGQNNPPKDAEEVTWIGDDRLRIDQGDTSSIVRLDTKKLILINHVDESYNVIDLPLDLSTFLPEQMAAQMKAMMTFDIEVTPTDERKKVGDWNTRRFDLKMVSKMMTLESTLWATTEIEVNLSAYHKMYQQIIGLQPGMEGMAEEMLKVEGLVVAMDGVMTMTMMGGSKVATTEEAVSIEKLDAPASTYDPPTGYTEETFDYMSVMQKRQ